MSDLLRFFISEDDGPPSYPRLVVDELIELKRDGWTWDRSWSIVTAQYPPPGSWAHSGQGTESPFHFLMRHCEAAWHGDRATMACTFCGGIPCNCDVVDFGAAA